MKLLNLDWYSHAPIDFEHKQYLLYAYLQDVDKSFLNKKVSPHLLHLERLKDEMDYFISKWIIMQKTFDKNRYAWFDNPKLEGEENKELAMVVEIVDYALPQIDARIRSGYVLFEKYPKQVLY
jgi:hypothetical protein|tara:strand:- start:195 stop:563 length:369 start_codon:yes stop_codon:yes gene_type:complete